MTRPLNIALLGATGSIGRQTLDVIDRNPGRFKLFGLTEGMRSSNRKAEHLVRGQAQGTQPVGVVEQPVGEQGQALRPPGDQMLARDQRRGLWADPSEPTTPSAVEQTARPGAEGRTGVPPDGVWACPVPQLIKGQITASTVELVRDLRTRGIVVAPRAGWVRTSPHFYISPDDIDRFLSELPAAGTRSLSAAFARPEVVAG